MGRWMFKPRKSAKETALDCLSRRALTYYELEMRLKDKGYESTEIKEALVKMEELGYLNDQELALTFAQSRLQRYSRRRVVQDLQKRGISPEVIEEVLESMYSSRDEFQNCFLLAQRWWVQEEKHWRQKSEKGLIDQSDKKEAKKTIPQELWLERKLARRLLQRGYPSDMVRNILDRIMKMKNLSGELDSWD
jgi:regulatory protein